MHEFDKEIKKSIEEIKPDLYMKTRLTAKINAYKKPKQQHIVKKICAAVLAAAIVCGSVGGYFAVQRQNDFTITAYADDGKTYPLSNHDVKMPFCKVEKVYHKEMDTTMLDATSSGFEINGKNIDEVTFKSNIYELNIYDEDMRDNQEERDDYFIVKIPLNDEEINEFNAINEWDSATTSKNFLKEMNESRDLSEYFGDNSINIDDYHVFPVNTTSKDIVEKFNLEYQGYVYTHFRLVKNEDYEDITRSGKKITEKNYDDEDKISDVCLDTWAATEYVMEHPDTKLSDLPKDTIEVTVKFISGKTATKNIQIEFDDLGYMHCQIEE